MDVVYFKAPANVVSRGAKSSFLATLEQHDAIPRDEQSRKRGHKRSPVGRQKPLPPVSRPEEPQKRSDAAESDIRSREQEALDTLSENPAENETVFERVAESEIVSFEAKKEQRKKAFCRVPLEFWNPYSRVGRAFREFAYEEHCLCEVLLKNFVASEIQAAWRGYVLRRKFREVISKAKAAAKEKNVATLRSALSCSKPKPAERNAKKHSDLTPTNASRLMSRLEKRSAASGEELSDSDWSDLGPEELEGLRYRCKTPPWQRQENARWAGVQAKMNYRSTRGGLDFLWDPVDSQARIKSVIARRGVHSQQSRGEPEPMLPPALVNALLLQRLQRKYQRLGLSTEGAVP